MLAVSAIAALLVTNRSHSASKFISDFNITTTEALLNQISTSEKIELNLTTKRYSYLNGQQRETVLCFTISPLSVQECRSIVLPKFFGQVEQRIKDCGGNIHDTGTLGDSRDLKHFDFSYSIGTIEGRFRAFSFEKPNGELEILILIDEW